MEKIKVKALIVSSEAFAEMGKIPKKYTCDGNDTNPPLHIGRVPEGTRSLALIVDDPDAPGGTFTHWVVWNIPVTDTIREDEIPGTEGVNSFKKHHYGGPCPPSGTHRYYFKVYALDKVLDLPENTRAEELEEAMETHVLAQGRLTGTYTR